MLSLEVGKTGIDKGGDKGFEIEDEDENEDEDDS